MEISLSLPLSPSLSLSGVWIEAYVSLNFRALEEKLYHEKEEHKNKAAQYVFLDSRGWFLESWLALTIGLE